MMINSLTPRQDQLHRWLKGKQAATVAEVEDTFQISQATAYREIRALVEAGLAVKIDGGVKPAPEAPVPAVQKACRYCGQLLNERTLFIIKLADGTQHNACCPHCGLMALDQEKAQAALASDYLYGRMTNASRAVYLLESSVCLCCEPSVLCFTSEEDARHFQMGFGGQIFNLEQAKAWMKELMLLG